MDAPKPAAPVKRYSKETEETLTNIREMTEATKNEDLAELEAKTEIKVVEPKKDFIRKPHLTDRPFRGHEGLEALKQQLEANRPTKKSTKRR